MQPNSRDYFRVTAKGEYGGAGGVEGEPLSPHAPRRAGDLPPVPGSSRRAGENKNNARGTKVPRPPSHPMPRAGEATRRPCRAAAEELGRTKNEADKKMRQPQERESMRAGEGREALLRLTKQICRADAHPGARVPFFSGVGEIPL